MTDVAQMLYNARRVAVPREFYSQAAPYLKTLTRDEASLRVRDVRENETVTTLWDELQADAASIEWQSSDGEVFDKLPRPLAYNEADALEDADVFAEDETSSQRRRGFKPVDNELAKLEDGRLCRFAMDFFLNDGDTDDEYLEDGDEYLTEEEDYSDDQDSERSVTVAHIIPPAMQCGQSPVPTTWRLQC